MLLLIGAYQTGLTGILDPFEIPAPDAGQAG